jgi:hypothetical protein
MAVTAVPARAAIVRAPVAASAYRGHRFQAAERGQICTSRRVDRAAAMLGRGLLGWDREVKRATGSHYRTALTDSRFLPVQSVPPPAAIGRLPQFVQMRAPPCERLPLGDFRLPLSDFIARHDDPPSFRPWPPVAGLPRLPRVASWPAGRRGH